MSAETTAWVRAQRNLARHRPRSTAMPMPPPLKGGLSDEPREAARLLDDDEVDELEALRAQTSEKTTPTTPTTPTE